MWANRVLLLLMAPLAIQAQSCGGSAATVAVTAPTILAETAPTTVAETAPTTTIIPLTPMRKDWNTTEGYCGEHSIQQIALYNGVWVSQAQARTLAGGELLLGNNSDTALSKLGFNFYNWNSDTPVSAANLKAYMLWIKQHILANRPVIFTARISGGEDPWYDHIMPAFGIVTSNKAAYDANDVLIWSNDYGQKITRSMSNSSFFAGWEDCEIPDYDGGCISNDNSTYGTAMGGLPDAYGLFMPVRMNITSWSDGSPADQEPFFSNTTASANYLLDVTQGIAVGEVFTVFRCDGPGSVPRDPRTIADLRAGVAGVACKTSATFTMAKGLVLDGSKFGLIKSNSVVYFVAIKGK